MIAGSAPVRTALRRCQTERMVAPPVEQQTAAPGDVEIRALDSVADVFAASAVLAEVWGGDRTGMPPNLLRALAHSGNYAVGLWEGDAMIGSSVAFFARPSARSMHSHITGVLPGHQHRGLGRLLKQHQREWALARDVGRITWTFDPLVARNAHFNLRVLGARITEYLVDHYGAMDDGVNLGDQSDRAMVTWTLAAPPAPTPDDARIAAVVAVPADIEGLRRSAPRDAADWRLRVREEFTARLAEGLVVGGFRDDLGYLFVQP